jgi:uncharacterized protein (DUF1501 family)
MTQRSDFLSRREVLRRASALGLVAPAATGLGLGLAAMGNAAAAGATGYKALVCVFMTGGNDAMNMVLSTDPSTWQRYDSVRGGVAEIALAAPGTPAKASSTVLHERLGGALGVTATGGEGLAFHPVMGGVRDLFNAKRLAVMANVGPMVGPLTKANYLSGAGARPSKLFSHNDQQTMWQAFGVEGSTRGWGGQFADLLMAGNQRAMFSGVSVAGNAVWLNGATVRGYQMGPAGPVRLGGTSGKVFGSSVVQQKLQAITRTAANPHLLEREHAAVMARGQDAEAVLASGLPLNGPWGTTGQTATTDPLLQYVEPDTGKSALNPLAYQLQAVARTIAARDTLGMTRQVFFVSMGGFDSHDNQPIAHARNMAKLAHAMAYFDRTLASMGVDQSVTTFTASDFGRTFTSNGDGTDHGWGGHHLMMGGAVRGGALYGRMPTLGPSDGKGGYDSPDLLPSGVILPSTSVDQYAATLGRWFGVGDAELSTILPGLNNWSASSRQLGFV